VGIEHNGPPPLPLTIVLHRNHVAVKGEWVGDVAAITSVLQSCHIPVTRPNGYGNVTDNNLVTCTRTRVTRTRKPAWVPPPPPPPIILIRILIPTLILIHLPTLHR